MMTQHYVYTVPCWHSTMLTQGHDDTALCQHTAMLTQHQLTEGHTNTARSQQSAMMTHNQPIQGHDDTAMLTVPCWQALCWHRAIMTQHHAETGPCWHSSTPLNMWLSSTIRNSALTLLLIILRVRYWFLSITLPNIWTSPHFWKIYCLSSCCEAVPHSVRDSFIIIYSYSNLCTSKQ